jgi:hypothetical protein
MVCLRRYPTGGVLIHKGKRPPRTKLDWGLCLQHKRHHIHKLIALVEIDPTKSNPDKAPDEVVRTGTVIYLSRPLYDHIFTGDPPESGVAFVGPEVVAILQRLRQIWNDGSQVH